MGIMVLKTEVCFSSHSFIPPGPDTVLGAGSTVAKWRHLTMSPRTYKLASEREVRPQTTQSIIITIIKKKYKLPGDLVTERLDLVL